MALLRVGTSSVPVAPPLKQRLAEALQQCLILDATEEDMLTRLEWVDGMGQGSYECWVMPCNMSTWEKAERSDGGLFVHTYKNEVTWGTMKVHQYLGL